MSKGPLALRTISEAAETLGVQQHVLRFWETKFPFIRPTKRAGGRRFYRPQDIILLQGVKTLLYDRGYTIRGVQKLFKDEGQKAISSIADPEIQASESAGPSPHGVAVLEALSGEDAQAFSPETRLRFLEIARSLEEAQIALGRALGRHRG